MFLTCRPADEALKGRVQVVRVGMDIANNFMLTLLFSLIADMSENPDGFRTDVIRALCDLADDYNLPGVAPEIAQEARDAGYGGKLAVRGAKIEVLEGEHDTRSVVMFEFPTMEAIHAFWNSPDYVPIKKLREGVATANVWAFSGV